MVDVTGRYSNTWYGLVAQLQGVIGELGIHT
jgi:hypothetical protein